MAESQHFNVSDYSGQYLYNQLITCLSREMDPWLKKVIDPPPISTTIHHPQIEVDVLRTIIRAKYD